MQHQEVIQKGTTVSYPIIDEHRRHYVKHPFWAEEENKWVGVDVYLPCGHSPIFPHFGRFDSEEECQRGCTIHNEWLGFTANEVQAIVARSMGL